MTLKCFTPPSQATRFDIVAVPAIGANPIVTFRYPGQPKPDLRDLSKWRHMFSAVTDARVFMYTFDPPEDAKSHGITKYAEDLLREMDDQGLGSNRPIHFVGHSTGGIVVKRALVVANGSNKPRILQIKRDCISVAFFGTPHHGSTVLCQSTYKQAVADLLGLNIPMSERVRQDLLKIENIDGVGSFSRVFQPLTINMEKIWSFHEAMASKLQVRAKSSTGSGSTTIARLVVEERSAALDGASLARYPVDCEELIPIIADHASLPRFGDRPNSRAYAKYIEKLQLQFRAIATVRGEGLDPRWLEHKLTVEVHRFHNLEEDNQMGIKLWSVYPLLYDLLEDGPEACLNNRIASALRPTTAIEQTARKDPPPPPSESAEPNPNRPRPRSNSSPDRQGNAKQPLKLQVENSCKGSADAHHERRPQSASTLVDSDPSKASREESSRPNNQRDDDAESDISSPSAYSLPEASRFRWIHIPCNHLVWVEKIFLAVEKEREKQWFDEIAESTPTSAETEIMAQSASPQDITMAETPTELLENALEDPLVANLLKAKERVEAKGIAVPDLKEVLMDPRQQAHLLKLAQNVSTQKRTNLIPEAAQVVEEIRENRIIVGTIKEKIREGQVPDPSVITQKLREDRDRPRLTSAVLDEGYWTRKQRNSRHGLPHGRYMESFCQIFLPKRSIETESIMGETIEQYVAPISSPIESPQLCFYMPYLHWDTFGSMEARNKLVKERLRLPVSLVRNRAVERGVSMEHKLIWQYLVDTSGLPLHIRRTLDQFGDPHLEDMGSRDKDQVLYKCTKPADDDPMTKEIFHSAKNRATRAEDAKVLMVDQLWCYVIDSNTVATFFTPKEDTASRPRTGCENGSRRGSHTNESAKSPADLGVDIPGDLRYQLYADINGDQRFARRCSDPFDFVAATIWHAITVFLDRAADEDLQVFTLFEERLCELVDYRIKSFKEFRDSQASASKIFQRMGYHSSATGNEFQKIIEALNPSHDLTALIELRDIQDELGMINTVFSKQAVVVNDLIHAYGLLDRAKDKSEPGNHGQAVRWLEDAKTQVIRYQERLKHLCEETKNSLEEYKFLLDMKQKQSNVIEAYFARIAAQTQGRQNRSILIFTIFTVIFLPLSFFTSLFSMNVREWTGTEKNKTLHTVLALMVPVSVFIIIAVLFLAFTQPILDGTTKAATRTVNTVKNGHKHFHKLRNWWKRRWDGASEEEEEDMAEVGTKPGMPDAGSWVGSCLDLEGPEQRMEMRRR